jgi:hypothetical protein
MTEENPPVNGSVPASTPNDNLDIDPGKTGERVFEISADLNITPVKDDEPGVAPPVQTIETVKESRGPINIPLKAITPTAPAQPAQAVPPPPRPSPTPSKNLLDNYVPPPTSPLAQPEPENSIVKRLRTYESDVAHVLAQQRASLTTMALAEQRAKSQSETISNAPSEPRHSSKKLLLSLLSLILFGVGVAGGYYLYLKSPLAPSEAVIEEVPPAPSLIASDLRANMEIDGLSPLALRSRIEAEIAKEQKPQTIKEIILTKTRTNQKLKVSGQEIIRDMDIDAPDILVRSLGQPWMLGVYADQSGNKDVFVVVTTEFFQNSFAGMLQWERVMADDLKQYLHPSTEPYFTIRGSFVDRIIKNKDVREFETEAGQTLFLYSFIDNSKLVITTKQTTLAEIIARLEKAVFIR